MLLVGTVFVALAILLLAIARIVLFVIAPAIRCSPSPRSPPRCCAVPARAALVHCLTSWPVVTTGISSGGGRCSEITSLAPRSFREPNPREGRGIAS
jgi:hypothetical protein